MKGQDVFDFTLREVPNSIKELCDISKVDINQIDRFLFHQSNKFIIKQLSMKLNLDLSKVLLNIEKYGNTSGVSIPLLMSSFRSEFLNTKYVLCSGYGSGLNWGNCIIDISKTKIDEIIIYN
jgi:3-oxoacyl-[acyl-carrier-protein] synthase-3